MLQPTIVSALNHLLHPADWARARLKPFEGHVLRVEIASFAFLLRIEPDGYLTDAAADDRPEVILSLPSEAVLKAPGGFEQVIRSVRIEGNADFADAIGFVSRQLRWDAEEDFSRVFGDIGAHRLLGGMRSLASAKLRGLRAGVENVAEYLADETSMLVRPPQAMAFSSEVAEASDALARLEKRLAKLEAGVRRDETRS
ncbi:MAG: hypothetical protein HGA47_02095 [Zoogloea sp.]|nr:hypothetical protein [Zoogloea sp.]